MHGQQIFCAMLMSSTVNLVVISSILALARSAAWVEEKYGKKNLKTSKTSICAQFAGPTLLPEGYNFELVHRHFVPKGQFQKGEYDKNVDNPDAELYSHLTVWIE